MARLTYGLQLILNEKSFDFYAISPQVNIHKIVKVTVMNFEFHLTSKESP